MLYGTQRGTSSYWQFVVHSGWGGHTILTCADDTYQELLGYSYLHLRRPASRS